MGLTGVPARVRAWTAAMCAPLLLALLWTVITMPFSLSEVVAVLFDLDAKPLREQLLGDGIYFRPVFWGILHTVWALTPSHDAALEVFRVLHAANLVLIVVLFALVCRPSTREQGAAFTLAFACLLAQSGLRDNLEQLPLNQTLMVMALALAALLVLEHRGRWGAAGAIGLTLAAISTKEQGLAIPAMLVAGALAGAPGVSRRTALVVGLLLAGYIGVRVAVPGEWPIFMRSAGYGFTELEPDALVQRFGAFPYGMYAYNVIATAGNVLIGEPSRGVFQITRDITRGDAAVWQWNQLLGSAATVLLVGVWGLHAWRRRVDGHEAARRLLVVFVFGALGTSALMGYNYTRDRFGGVPAVIWAVCLYHAAHWLLVRVTLAASVSRTRATALVVAAFALAGSWQLRAAGTIEYQRRWAWRIEREWLVDYVERQQLPSYGQPGYQRLMREMYGQGIDPSVPSTDSEPAWVIEWLDAPR